MSNHRDREQMKRLFMSRQEADWIEGLERRVDRLWASYKMCPFFRFRKRRKLYAEYQEAAHELMTACENHMNAIAQLDVMLP